MHPISQSSRYSSPYHDANQVFFSLNHRVHDIAKQAFRLANIYNNPRNVIFCPEKARYWYERAANNGHPKACFHLAYFFLYGVGGPVDRDKAEECFQKVLEKTPPGDAKERVTLLIQAAKGYDQEWLKYGLFLKSKRELDHATKWIEKAAIAKNAKAMIELGHLYKQRGRNSEAAFWFRECLQQKHAEGALKTEAHFELGIHYEKMGKHLIAMRHFKTSANHRNKAAKEHWQFNRDCLEAQKGNQEAMLRAGQKLEEWEDLQGALDWYTAFAEEGHPNALFRAANILEQDNSDLDRAMDYYKKAAKLDHLPSMHRLGGLYESGFERTKAPSFRRISISYFAEAADQNYLPSVIKMAKYFRSKSDLEKAAIYLKQASDLGSPSASFELFKLYFDMEKPEAYDFLLLAANRNHAEAAFLVGEISLTDNERDMAIAWYRKAAAYFYPPALCKMGEFMEKEERYDTAMRCYFLAAKHGFAKAYACLGDIYAEGRGGIQKNESLARKFYQTAKQKGYQSAETNLAYLEHLARSKISTPLR